MRPLELANDNEGRALTTRPFKRGLFAFEIAQAFCSAFYLNGQPFYAHARYGWNAPQIALSQALLGFLIASGSYYGGQLAHRRNPRLSLGIGIAGGIAGAVIGLLAGAAGLGSVGMLLSLTVFCFFQAMVWPPFEATLMSAEPPERVQNFVGVFNLVWSLGSATAVLLATALMTRFGMNVFFALPALGYTFNALLFFLLLPNYDRAAKPTRENAPPALPAEEEASALTPAQHNAFRWLGWLTSPFAYLAINATVTYNPTIQERLGLSFATASAWCSVWFYVRCFAFEWLRRWTGWHYRWRLLCAGFGLLAVSFLAMMLAPSLPVFVVAQIGFGLSAGLLYQSSFFYSMAESDAQGAHGGSHEAFIGVGQMLGPIVIFGSGWLVPAAKTLPIWLVFGLMLVGLAVLLRIGKRTEKRV